MKRQIVDSEDNPIGAKSDAQLDVARDIYRVSALWVTNSQGQVLLAQRGLDDNNGAGQWGPAVAGTVEEGEAYVQNIYKEAAEEIGLIATQLELGPKQKVTGDRNFFCQWFTAVVNKPIDSFTLQADEVAAVRWVNEQELLKDIQAHPKRYIANMLQIFRLFAR